MPGTASRRGLVPNLGRGTATCAYADHTDVVSCAEADCLGAREPQGRGGPPNALRPDHDPLSIYAFAHTFRCNDLPGHRFRGRVEGCIVTVLTHRERSRR